jgi:hypothetical protein
MVGDDFDFEEGELFMFDDLLCTLLIAHWWMMGRGSEVGVIDRGKPDIIVIGDFFWRVVACCLLRVVCGIVSTIS